MTAIPNSTPRWLGHATSEASPNSANGSTQSVRVYLAPKGGAAAEAAAVKAVSTPGSSSYRQYLTAAQFFATYAPTPASAAAVRSWLTKSGLTISSTETHNRWVDARGSTAALDKAFGVSLQAYAHDGQNVTAPNGPTNVPDALASTVSAVDGLDTTVVKATPAATAATPADPPPAAFRNGRPCSAYYGQIKATTEADYSTPLPKYNGQVLPYAVCGYTGPQFRAAYEGSTNLTGKNVTVGIIDAYAAPTIAADAQTYAANHGDAGYASGQLTQTVPATFTNADLCGPSGWYGEETLDVEAVHAMAGNAKIHYYGGASCLDDDLRATQQQLVDDDAVSIVSNSYGEPDEDASAASITADTAVFQQAALEGISFTFSSGDDGDEVANTGLKQSDSSASNPYVTAVGGTSTAIGSDGTIHGQTGWGTEKSTLRSDGKAWVSVGYLYGSGGGYSNLYNRPSYQNGVVSANAPNGRAVPDVAMDADPTTGMLIGETQTNPDGTTSYGEYRIGGTSLASPLFAGMTALKIQGTGRLGFLNPLIYANTSQFLDVQGPRFQAGNVRVDYANGFDPSDGLVYSVRTFNQDASLTTAPGWDDVTGVGVPGTKWLTKSGTA